MYKDVPQCKQYSVDTTVYATVLEHDCVPHHLHLHICSQATSVEQNSFRMWSQPSACKHYNTSSHLPHETIHQGIVVPHLVEEEEEEEEQEEEEEEKVEEEEEEEKEEEEKIQFTSH